MVNVCVAKKLENSALVSYRTNVRYLLYCFKIPRRSAFSEVAHARHNSSELDSALAYSQYSLCRNDKLRSVRVYIELTFNNDVSKVIRHCFCKDIHIWIK